MKIETYNIPVISTAHIGWDAAKELKDKHYARDWFGYGWILQALFEDECPEAPKCIQDIWQWAQVHEFTHVLLDRDAEVVDGLPTYDW